MASRSCLILCFAFILLSGFVNSLGPNPNCSGECISVKECSKDCSTRGFNKGGYCLGMGLKPNFELCCCN
ncbi:unnamed protein product [Lathyrus oleraceus]